MHCIILHYIISITLIKLHYNTFCYFALLCITSRYTSSTSSYIMSCPVYFNFVYSNDIYVSSKCFKFFRNLLTKYDLIY